MQCEPATTCSSLSGAPLYVEVSSLLNRRLTGIGRFVARLLEALTHVRPLRLVTTVQAELARNSRLSTALQCGQEIALNLGDTHSADGDVASWTRTILRLPRRRHDLALSRRCPGLYTMLRPPQRHFYRELCLLYDFTPSVLPWSHTRDTRNSYGIFFTNTAALCDKAVAISQSTQADARWLCALPPEDVIVGYPGPSLCVREHAHEESVTRRENVILVVSTLEPRKNGKFLIDWFLESEALPPGAELWWVGPPGWLCDRFKLMRRRGRGREIRFMGMISDRRLCQAYRQATLSIYPSLYEGFGFPVLDSLWHGTPVLSGYNSSLEEFAGSGVFYFDACDPASLDAAYAEMQAVQPIIIDPEPLRSRFSWEVLARQVHALCA